MPTQATESLSLTFEVQWHASMSAAEILQKHLGLIRQCKKTILKTILANITEPSNDVYHTVIKYSE